MSPDTVALLQRLVDVLANVLYVLILVRLVVSWLNVSPWNPLVHWLRLIVDPILRPFRRVLPSFGGIDFSPLLAILVIFFVARLLDALLGLAVGGGLNVGAQLVGLIRDVVTNVIIVLAVLVLIRLLLSLFNADPWHPLVQGIRAVTGPLVAPFSSLRRRGYRSGADLPAVAALAAYVVLYFVAQFVFTQLLLHTV